MKKGLIVLGIALVAAFLFREGQREGVSTLAKNTGKSLEVQTEKLQSLDSNTNVSGQTPQPVTPAPSTMPLASVEAPQQMQAREIVSRDQTRQVQKYAQPGTEELRSNSILRASPWKVWTGVRAVPKVNVEPGDEVVGLTSGYAIIKDGTMFGDDQNFSLKNPMVVFDENSGRVGVVPGRVKLTLKDTKFMTSIQKEYGLSVVNRFPHLRLFFVTSSLQNFDLSKLVAFLKKDKRVEKADLEIVSGNRVKN
ncbi:hypothetical protein [Bdellovibrio sp. HCB288]|uniref:hypothetical protein n=1 Tax=Bdellovibrio sp. HCB288 TaxID=3394355 RepID=UPI0039B44E31